MSIQGGMVLGIAALAVLYFGRKVCATLGKKGANAGCGCESGDCRKGRRD
jgi:hypothetical protein